MIRRLTFQKPNISSQTVYRIAIGTLTLCFFLLPFLVGAQALEGRIAFAIDRLIVLLNVILVGAVAWAGFLLIKGESSAVTRLIYTIAALVVVNSARLFIDFFR